MNNDEEINDVWWFTLPKVLMQLDDETDIKPGISDNPVQLSKGVIWILRIMSNFQHDRKITESILHDVTMWAELFFWKYREGTSKWQYPPV